jgi:hypothetical protein
MSATEDPTCDAEIERGFRARCAPDQVVLRFYSWRTNTITLVRVLARDVPGAVRDAIATQLADEMGECGRHTLAALGHLRSEWVRRMRATGGWLESAQLSSTDRMKPECMTVYV